VSKPRIIKDYSKLEKGLQKDIKAKYPDGYDDFLITFQNKDGQFVSALPFETEDAFYLVKMPVKVAPKSKDEDDYENYDNDIAEEADEESFDEISDESFDED
jgi:hypothetical protein